MFIEFELQGSKCLHKGIFDTTGFWVKYEAETETDQRFNSVPEGFKIFSHFSFAFFHTDEQIVKQVYGGLVAALCGLDWHVEKIGFIRNIC